MDLLIVKLRLSLHVFFNVCVYCFRCAMISYWFGCLLSLLLTASLTIGLYIPMFGVVQIVWT